MNGQLMLSCAALLALLESATACSPSAHNDPELQAPQQEGTGGASTGGAASASGGGTSSSGGTLGSSSGGQTGGSGGNRDGSGGDGRYRGGLGQVIAFRVQSDQPATCSVLCDRTRIPAQGFFGGGPGLPGQVLINGRAPANPKGEQTLQPGDRVEIMLPGGGGYGPPAERDLALRARDLQQGYVTAAGAGLAAG